MWVPLLERRGGFSPRKLSGTGSVKERGKGLRRTGVRRAAAAAPGPGRGGRVPYNGCALPSRPDLKKNVHVRPASPISKENMHVRRLHWRRGESGRPRLHVRPVLSALSSRNPYKTLHSLTFLSRRAKRAGEKFCLFASNPYKTLHFLTFLTRRAKRAGENLPFCINPLGNLAFIYIPDPAREARRGEFWPLLEPVYLGQTSSDKKHLFEKDSF